MPEPNFSKLTSMHFYGWKKGLKTGQYYLRSRPSRDAIKFTVNVEALLAASDAGNKEEIMKVLIKNEEDQKKRLYVSEKEKLASPEKNGKAKEEEQEEVIFECTNCSS